MAQSKPVDGPRVIPARQPHSVIGQPATVEACRADYEAGADVRAAMAKQDARERR